MVTTVVKEMPRDDVELAVEQEIERMLPSGFHIHDHESAAWVVRHIRTARAYGLRVREWAERERRRAECEEKRLLFMFGGQLRVWAQSEIAKLKGRRKSLSLPSGVLGFRASRASVVIDDEQAVLDWARKHCPSAIVVSERLSRTAFNEHVAATGEVPDVGVHLEAEREVFYVR